MIPLRTQKLQGIARKYCRHVLDGLIPIRCPITGRRLSTIGVLDPEIWSKIHFVSDPVCDRCGAPFAFDYGRDAQCPSCIANPPDFDRARAAVVYGEISHRLIVAFKSNDRTEIAPVLANWLAICGRPIFASNKTLAPIPLHPTAMAKRKYNQAAILAQALAAKAGMDVCFNGLRRKRVTRPQKDLSADARQRNVAGAFEADSRYVSGAHIVLIDDVLTTGATVSAAARALRAAGAASVEALVVARVVKGGGGAI